MPAIRRPTSFDCLDLLSFTLNGCLLTASQPYDERMLLAKIARGDEKAFSELFHRYSDLLGTLILRFSGSKTIAEDVVQEVFLKIWMGREALSNVQNFKAFLYVIARNHALNTVRKAFQEKKLIRDLPVATTEADDSILHKKLNEVHFGVLDDAIAQLPPQQQRIFLMSRRDHMKHKEIAKATGLSQETVKKYIQLAVASINSYVKNKIHFVLMLLVQNFF